MELKPLKHFSDFKFFLCLLIVPYGIETNQLQILLQHLFLLIVPF